jgi:hypothetical protein
MKSMSIMNSFVQDMFERIVGEASGLIHLTKRATLSSREIQTACRLVLPGELGNHAVHEGTKCMAKYLTTSEEEKVKKAERDAAKEATAQGASKAGRPKAGAKPLKKGK